MFRQSSYLFLAKVLGYGIRILLPVFLTRTLTQADFGSYSQFFLIEVIFQVIFQLGVSQSQFYFVPKDPKNAGGIFLNSLVLSTFFYISAYGLIGIFRHELSTYLKMPVLVEMFWLLAAYSLFLMLTVCANTYLMARKSFKMAAVFEVSTQIVVSIATLVAAYLTRDLKAIFAILVLARIVTLLAVLLFVHFKLNGFASERYFFGMRRQVAYGITLGLAGTLWTLIMCMHELSVSKFFDIETYAVYAAGAKQVPVLMFFTQSIGPVALVDFAQLKARDDWEGIRKLWDKVLGMTFGVGIPITLFFVVVAKPLIAVMFPVAYKDAVFIFQMAAIGALFQLLVPSRVLRAMNRNDISLKVHGATFLLMPAALWVGKSLGDTQGIVTVNAIMLITARVATQYFLNRLTPVHLRYVPRFAEIWAFYKESYGKGRESIGRHLAWGRK